MQSSSPREINSIDPMHPIFRPVDFFVDTPQIIQLQETITRWLWHGQTGGYVLGDPRHGKTRAAEIIEKHLLSRTGQRVPTYLITISDRDVKTILAIFRRLANSLGIAVRSRDTSDQLADRIMFFLADQACTIATRQVVLLVDEMQRLEIKQLSPFAELYDRLRTYMHINLLVVFIGNLQESTALLEKVNTSGCSHVRGRFFTNRHHYTGLSSAKDVQYCLNQYDNICWPPDTGKKITQELLPIHYKNGFRLSQIAPIMWSIVKKEFLCPLQIQSWGMQYFTTAVTILLLDYFPNNTVEKKDQVEYMIKESIDKSGLVPDLVRVSSD